MKNKILMACFIAVTVAVSPILLSAKTVQVDNTIGRAENWTLLGSRTVDYLIDRDEISVDAGVFSELKFNIKNAPLSMHKCTLHFVDGSTEDIEFPDNVQSSTERPIDMKGSNKKLDKVIFWYDTKIKSESKALVELWGKK